MSPVRVSNPRDESHKSINKLSIRVCFVNKLNNAARVENAMRLEKCEATFTNAPMKLMASRFALHASSGFQFQLKADLH